MSGDETDEGLEPGGSAEGPSEDESDATVVSPRGEDERTVVVPREEPDATVLAARRDPEATIVAPGTGTGRRDRGARRGRGAIADPAPPVSDPTAVHSGRAAAPWTTRVYGARELPAASASEASSVLADDEVLQTLGEPPTEAASGEPLNRKQLPSLARRFRRRRVATLVWYAVAVVTAAVGLPIIARLAFG